MKAGPMFDPMFANKQELETAYAALRELNAELLAHLRDAEDALRRDEPTEAVRDIRQAIAKAEAMK